MTINKDINIGTEGYSLMFFKRGYSIVDASKIKLPTKPIPTPKSWTNKDQNK